MDEVETMIPFERDIYLQMLQAKMEEDAERAERASGGQG